MAQPAFPTLVSRTNSKLSGVWMKWKHGFPEHYAISNLTTGQFYLGFPENSFLFPSASGTTNLFIVGNTNGVSNTLQAVSTNQVWESSIVVHTYLVTLPIKSNVWCDIWRSTNLLTWKRIAVIVAPTNSYQFVWTNDFGNMFFRSSTQ